MMQKSCMESLSSLWNNGLGIYHKAGFFLHHSVYPISQHRSYTTHLILGHYNIYLSSKTLSVKLYKVKQVCFYCNYTYFLPFASRLQQTQRVQLLFSYTKKNLAIFQLQIGLVLATDLSLELASLVTCPYIRNSSKRSR